jgi:hypothetical protein
VSAGTFICGAIGKPATLLRDLQSDPALLAKTADKHGICIAWAREYIAREISAKTSGRYAT